MSTAEFVRTARADTGAHRRRFRRDSAFRKGSRAAARSRRRRHRACAQFGAERTWQYEYIPGQMAARFRVVIRLRETRCPIDGRSRPHADLRHQFRVGSTALVTEFVVDEAGVTQVMGSGWQQLLARLTNR